VRVKNGDISNQTAEKLVLFDLNLVIDKKMRWIPKRNQRICTFLDQAFVSDFCFEVLMPPSLLYGEYFFRLVQAGCVAITRKHVIHTKEELMELMRSRVPHACFSRMPLDFGGCQGVTVCETSEDLLRMLGEVVKW